MYYRKKKIILVYHAFHSKSDNGDRKNYVSDGVSVDVEMLSSHLKWLSKFSEFVTLDKLINSECQSSWQVAVTIDDGYYNNLDDALKKFEKFGAPVTWFVTTKFIESDTMPWWDLVDFLVRHEQPVVKIDSPKGSFRFDLRRRRQRNRFATKCSQWFKSLRKGELSEIRGQIKESSNLSLPSNSFASKQDVKIVSQSPLVDIGGHTVSHPNLSRLAIGDARDEVRTGKKKLEEWTGQSLRWFAFPYGGLDHWNDCTKRIVSEEGFEGAFTTVRAYADQAKDRFEIPRLTVPNTQSLWKVKAWILATNTCRKLYRLKQKLIG